MYEIKLKKKCHVLYFISCGMEKKMLFIVFHFLWIEDGIKREISVWLASFVTCGHTKNFRQTEVMKMFNLYRIILALTMTMALFSFTFAEEEEATTPCPSMSAGEESSGESTTEKPKDSKRFSDAFKNGMGLLG